MNPGRIVLAGGSGFLGTAVAAEWQRRGHEVCVLTRAPRARKDGVREVAWDGANPGPWTAELAGAAAVINLTGKNINCPHTPENLRGIIESRVRSVQAVAAGLARETDLPPVWVQASATGFYGDTADRCCDESAPNGQDALARVCRDWESAFDQAPVPSNLRRVGLRIGFVLGQGGGALPVLAGLTRAFLGGAVGSGRQYISWIHLQDLVRIFVTAVEDASFTGYYNAVAPNPATNAAFMRELRRVLHRPWSPPAPTFAVRLGARLMGSEPSLALVSQRCAPTRLVAAGFSFRFPELGPALQDLCAPK